MSNDGQNQQNTPDDQQQGLGQSTDTGRGGSDETANNPGYDDSSAQDERTEQGSQQDAQQSSSAAKDPKDWVTGDEDATPAQKSYLSTMAVEVREAVPNNLTKAEASEKIQELQEKTGRDTNTERP